VISALAAKAKTLSTSTLQILHSILRWLVTRAQAKTRKSHRTLELPQRCVNALRLRRDRQDQLRKRAGARWHDNNLVLTCALTGVLGPLLRRLELDGRPAARSYICVLPASPRAAEWHNAEACGMAAIWVGQAT
jgi:hypothetical protein